MPPKRPAEEAAASEVVKKPRVACTFPGCDKSFCKISNLNIHIQAAHKGVVHACIFDGCQKTFRQRCGLTKHIKKHHNPEVVTERPPGRRVSCTFPGCGKDFKTTGNLNQHIREAHIGLVHACIFDGCQKKFRQHSGLTKHIKKCHKNQTPPAEVGRVSCTFPGCGKEFDRPDNLERHIRLKHERNSASFNAIPKKSTSPKKSEQRHACTFDGCPKDFASRNSLRRHLKSQHGTPDEIAELQKKKLAIRQHLADKETQGLCSATESCPHPALEGSFRCQIHEKPVSALDKALKDREEQCKLLADSIQNPDEFALLLQRPEIFLSGTSKASLSNLALGLDGVHGSSKAFVMDTEFIQVRGGHLVPLDLTIMRLDGEVIVSTRVDWDMTIKDLEAFCKTRIGQSTIRKVYGKSDRTWGKTPEQIIDILQNARIFSPDAMI
ncbi:hypothetical protein LA080_004384 [Diaporthe eres]|nr:hypothetical protein LA080_004384 [Diaporthe eres]